MLDTKNMSKESREAEIDKILAETARNPYKKIKPLAPARRPEAPKRPETPKDSMQSIPIKKAEPEQPAISEKSRENIESAKAAAAEKIKRIKAETLRAEDESNKKSEYKNLFSSTDDVKNEFPEKAESEIEFED